MGLLYIYIHVYIIFLFAFVEVSLPVYDWIPCQIVADKNAFVDREG